MNTTEKTPTSERSNSLQLLVELEKNLLSEVDSLRVLEQRQTESETALEQLLSLLEESKRAQDASLACLSHLPKPDEWGRNQQLLDYIYRSLGGSTTSLPPSTGSLIPPKCPAHTALRPPP